MTSLDIIIVNWNSGQHLQSCLASIVTASRDGFKLDRVVVVDNASTDNSISRLECFDLPLVLIPNTQNRGFAAACNHGARGGHADYLLFLNPDVRLFAGSLSKPLRFMEKPQHRAIGICGIKLVDENGQFTTSAARFPTPWILTGKITGLSVILPKIFPPHLLPVEELSQSKVVDQVIGAFFLVRREVYDICNGFDERFFVYFEEVDFALRAKRNGFLSYYLSSVEAFHKGGASSEKVKATRLFYSLRSRTCYSQKHYSVFANILLIVLTLTVEFGARILFSIKGRSLSSLSELILGYGMFVNAFLFARGKEGVHQR